MVGAEAEQVQSMVADVEKREWEADRLQYTLSQQLFALEDEMKTTDIFLWFRVYGELGQLANFAEKTGDQAPRQFTTVEHRMRTSSLSRFAGTRWVVRISRIIPLSSKGSPGSTSATSTDSTRRRLVAAPARATRWVTTPPM